MNIPRLAADKANHLIWGYAAGLVGVAAATGFGRPDLAGPAAQALALIAGLAKELLDWLANEGAWMAGKPPPHTVDPLDVLATYCGGLAVHAALVLHGGGV